jgi:serine/threonine protein kinase
VKERESHLGDEDTEHDHTMDAVPRLPRSGSVVDGRYLVMEAIGEGGFGWVFKVQHVQLGQNFAMKILHPRISADPEWRIRFREEARATSLIGNENIVFVTDFGECPKFGYYFVMEHLIGSSLAEHLEVHELGIVHCDLKPGNVMMVDRPNRNEAWKFLDFGTANVVTRTVESDFIYGTPAYMAPEQAVGVDVDPRADQFSLACVIYEMLTGCLPWRVKSWTDALPEVRRQNPPQSLANFRKDCPPGLNEVIQKALSLRRSARFATIAEFVKAMSDMVPIDFEPTHDPQDIKGTSGQGFKRSPTAPQLRQPVDAAGASMVITLGEDSEADVLAVEVNIVFQSADRLGREYRRNIIAGGMFIPSGNILPLHSAVRIHLTLAPRKMSIELDARVVSQTLTGGHAVVGFGVYLSPESLRHLELWIKNPVIGLQLEPKDILTRLRQLDPNDSLAAAEAFIVSMLVEPTSVQRLRAMCSGLPIDFNECIASLIQKAYVDIKSLHSTDVSEVVGPVAPRLEFLASDVERIMDQADFFERQHNFWGAISTLRRALEIVPEKSAIHYRLARLENGFLSHRSEASRLMQQAIGLDPKNLEYQEFMTSLDPASSDES